MFRVEMLNPQRFYTYAYLREDRTPYYIGKGQTRRLYQKCGKPCGVPKDKSRIIKLKHNLTEEEAFRHEIYMIAVFGRKDYCVSSRSDTRTSQSPTRCPIILTYTQRTDDTSFLQRNLLLLQRRTRGSTLWCLPTDCEYLQSIWCAGFLWV